MKNVLEVIKSFQARLPNAEQADRLSAIRKAASAFGAVIWQGTKPSEFRDRSMLLIHETLMYAEAAICHEETSEAGIATREKLLAKLASGRPATAREIAILRGMLGMFAPEEIEEPGGKKQAETTPAA